MKPKIHKLKEWVTLAEAAKHLNLVFGEVLEEADLLQLALEGHLILSFHFINRQAAKLASIPEYKEIAKALESLSLTTQYESDNVLIKLSPGSVLS